MLASLAFATTFASRIVNAKGFMAYQIRQLSFGEVLDRAVRVLIDNALVLIAISAIVEVPMTLLSSIGPKVLIVTGLLSLAVVPLLQAAIAIAITEIYLDRPITIEKAYWSAW